MKSKTRVIKSDNTYVVEYYKVKDPFNFRFRMLTGIIKPYEEVYFFIDTNAKTNDSQKDIGEYLEKNNIPHRTFMIKKTERKLLGISIKNFMGSNTSAPEEKYIIAKLNPEFITEEFYNDCLKTYDIAIGIEPNMDLNKMTESYRENMKDLYFNKDYFEDFTYDSVLFTSIRSTTDIRELAEKSEK